MSSYHDFLLSKRHTLGDFGFEPIWMPNGAFDFQEKIISRSIQKGRIGVFADTGLGKEQPVSEPVLTPNGWKTMGDLSVGDYVIGKNGLPTKVLGVYPQGVKPVYRLNLSDGTFVRAGADHLWSVRTKVHKYRGQEFQTKTTMDIMESLHRDWQLPMINPEYTDDVSLGIDPYALGVMLGDGDSKRMHDICTDKWIGDYLGWRKKNTHESCEYVGYYSAGSSMIDQLKDAGLWGLESHTKFVPVEYMHSSPSQRLELLNGLMDTDGYAMPDGGAEFSSTSRNLVDSVCELVRSLGGVARGYRECKSEFTYNGEKRTGKKAWRVNVKLPNHLDMFKLPRKASAYVNPTKYEPVRIIRDVVFEGVEEEQVCINVEAEDSLYITRDYIVTHNTLMQLGIAENVVRKTNGNVLILTPLAVAFQFLKESERIGIDDIEHSKDGKFRKKIVVCNYERLHHLDPDDFECVILDESSILKNFQGRVKDQIIAFIKRVKYRFLSSATPAPNDFIELGNSSEALGYMGYMDMLGKFFKSNQNSVDSNNRNIGEKFYLKPHAEKDFFAWVNQWSIMIKRPSDLGFSDKGYDLPAMHVNKHMVHNESTWCIDGQSSLFAMPAKTMTEVREEQKQTITERCEKAIELASGKTSVYWCNLNEESALLHELDPEAVEIKGGMSIDKKEELLLAFADGEIERLITKAKMTSMGLNWQHCNHTVYFPTWSYEQWYQAIRRFWRFGQQREVTCDMVISEGQERVMEALEQKTQKAIDLYENLVQNSNRDFNYIPKDHDKEIILPSFI